MMSSGINYWAVLVAGVAYMALGAIWYAPPIFGNTWLKGIGKTKEQIASSSSAMNYIWALIASFVAAYGIARIMVWTGGSSITDGLKVAFVAGICFVLTSFSVNDCFEHRPKGLTIGNILYHVIGLLIAGVIIGAWR